MDGRTVIVTGGSSGVGYFAAEQLAQLGADVVIAARDRGRAAAAARSIQAEVPGASVRHERLDLSSLSSVRHGARRLLETGPVHAVVANAAAVGLPDHVKPRTERGPRPRTTDDGHELHWGTNHLGHFALISLLMPALLESHGRVVHVGSLIHRRPGQPAHSRPDPAEPQSDLHKYARSKLAVMSFGFELSRRLADSVPQTRSGATSVVVHPGTALDVLSPHREGVAVNQPQGSTALRRVVAAITHGKHEAARVLVHAVASPGVGNGDYWGPGGWMQLRGEPARCTPHAKALDPQAAARLVSLSEELSGVRLAL
jgi:NAD(P)-dependent dehydrogenase (short-subunit alcohol dehydrogenase family)